MANIDDKLTYLSETKNIFKNSLNSLGAEITSSTTFRNYLNWLDSFYDTVSDKTDIITNGIVGRTSQSVGSLPIEYTQVDYIESSRTQYIDTGVNADSNLRVVIDMAYSDMVLTNNGSIIGAIRNTNGAYTRYHLGLTSTAFIFYSNTSSKSISPVNTNRHIFDLNVPNLVFKIDDSSTTLTSSTFDTQLNFWLFGRNSNVNNLKAYSAQKLYNAKFYYNGELIRDFIPCYRRSDNKTGLYDIVNNVFYPCQGTGEFTYGTVVNTLSPDSPQPINNLSGDVAYKVSGKNLFNKNNITQNKYIDINNEITDGQDWVISDYIPVIENETYTYQGLTTAGTAPYSAYYDENKNLVSTFKQAVGVNTITIPSNARYVRFSIRNNTANHNIDTFMIEKGSTAGTYESYMEPRTFTIPLGNIVLNNIDGNVDNIHSENGKFYLYKETGIHILNGSESWGYSSSPSTPTPRTVAFITHTDSDNSKKYYSNRFVYNDTSTSNRLVLGSSSTGVGRFYVSLDNTLTGIASSDTNDQKVEKMKTYISNNNIEVDYVLITPTTTEITSSNYPELYNALKEIQDYLVSYKINKEFLLDYSSPEIEY